MADSEQPKKLPRKTAELSMEKRMLLAFGLVGLVLIISQLLYSPAAPSKSGPKQVEPVTSTQAVKPAAPVPQPKAVEPAKPAETSVVAAPGEEAYTIDTDVFRIVFTNRGGVVRSWQLKHYRDTTGKILELVNPNAAGKTALPFSWVFDDVKPPVDLNQSLFVARTTPDSLGIVFEFSDGQFTATKSFRFARDSYLFQNVSEVRSNETGVPHLLAWRGGFGDRAAYAHAASVKALYFDVSANGLVENDGSVARDEPVGVTGRYSFAGIEDTYFLAVFLPEDPSMKVLTLSDRIKPAEGGDEEELAGVAVGGDARNEFSVFVGPKDLTLLRRINPKLEAAVDFGWFSFLARPIFLALKWLNDNFVHNYGWSIVLLTIIINMLLLPLKISGMKGMKKMSALQPEIQKINEKYKNIKISDPRKAQQNQEVMELYKKHGVNPLGAGCMPLLLQIPFFFAFYKVLSVAIELRGADWLWIRDLSHYDPWYLLPIVMVVTQFVVQKMTPNTSMDPAQQRMMMFMPLMFGFLFFKASAGLVLYWLTGNVVSIVQQWFINRMTPAPAPAVAAVSTPKKPVKTVRK